MNYIEANRKLWNQRVDNHIASKFYDNESFMEGRSSLNNIELALLGDINNQSMLHLQCHFGQDSLSMARMGAKVLGVDLSDKAIETARELNQKLGLNAEFLCHDVLTLDQTLTQTFDTVFSSYGTIGWLPDIQQWAKIVSQSLKPGGRFIFVEFHPMIWMFNRDFSFIEHSYFNQGVIVEAFDQSYAEESSHSEVLNEYGWNHSLSDVFSALIDNGLTIGQFQEYDYSPYDCFSKCVKSENGFQIKSLEKKLPMIYSLTAIK